MGKIIKMFKISELVYKSKDALSVSGIGVYSLRDTLECGQCFRHELIEDSDGYLEYITVIKEKIVRVGQRAPGELIFFDTKEEEIRGFVGEYFSLYTDYEALREDILSRTESDWLRRAAEAGGGIGILKQDEWETLFSFIISQNNNIPRIRKIIRQLCAEYGVNLCLQNGISVCPLSKIDGTPCDEKCKSCGICYSFPKPEDIVKNPEKMLPSRPGFRYKYLLDAAVSVCDGSIDLAAIKERKSYEYTLEQLKKIKGVGDKVASCVALFGFNNLEAFPVDVWMKRAIDKYFDGNLDPLTLGKYAGIAQQYIFHYIRNINEDNG